jgi:hypothetical protein
VTPPTVQFIPAPAASSPNWQTLADISSVNARNANLTYIITGGEIGNFDVYSTNPVRTDTSYSYIEYIFEATGWSAGTFGTATSNRVYTFEINGLAVPHTSITEIFPSGNQLCRIRFNGSLSAFWSSNVVVGNSVAFSVTYS